MKGNGLMLYLVPQELRDERMCRLAVQSKALRHVPVVLRTMSLCEEAVQSRGWALRWVPEQYRRRTLQTTADLVERFHWTDLGRKLFVCPRFKSRQSKRAKQR